LGGEGRVSKSKNIARFGWREMHLVGLAILGRPRPSRDARLYLEMNPNKKAARVGGL
jgi:hypothetical protein